MDFNYIRGVAYFVVTALLLLFLYGYIYNLYARQRSGKEDYEKYSDLALKDNLDDELIDTRR